MEEYETLSGVCGYHEYQRVWMVCLEWWQCRGKELQCERERLQNPTDPYAEKDGITVGKSMW